MAGKETCVPLCLGVLISHPYRFSAKYTIKILAGFVAINPEADHSCLAESTSKDIIQKCIIPTHIHQKSAQVTI